ncbi:hypothetical protein HYDPIDRAFT_29304 [Hydnomerulius pinastri MD-312]|uniref:Unplaced genomic scaffold scaffold_16, whole genome shotgun sequence n=1 Tax=Hydnomerulius pinastri MD-312 TaxID=994086 RepID=A0A0C9W7Z9_9AGAM|nr:hypothetical protein HYDPIDRAFT_29304 [Hydnomerulius pinastri MD-312]
MAAARKSSSSPSTTTSLLPITSLSSSVSTPTTESARDHIYKGKYTNRSWQQLPPELVRTIATHYLLDLQVSNYCPVTWDAKELWGPRIAYTTFRDANDLEKLMQVTPSWAAALETHLFWNKACAHLDPYDALAHCQFVRPQPSVGGAGGAATAQPQPYRLTPFRHFRQMATHSCVVCRINSPFSSVGLAAAKRPHHVPVIGAITLCREHRKTTFCGVCLREAPPAEFDPQFDIQGNTMRFSGYNQPYGPAAHLSIGMGGYNPYPTALNPALMVCCAENEDDETWPGVDMTCRSCRSEGLWQRISTSLRDREAVGGPRFVPSTSQGSSRSIKDRQGTTISRHPPAKYASADWETRSTVDAFIDLGEGSITEVINVAREKFWLRSQTKMPELMEQAVAATRWAGEGMGVDFTPHTPAVNNQASTHLESSGGAAAPETAVVNVANDVAESYSPANSTSPSPPSPRSAQRSRSPSPRSVYSSEYEGSEEEEDTELLSLTEDAGGVRELAISDWTRSRILDGHWCSPADQWYGHAWPAGGAVRDAGEETESEPDPDEEMREGSSVRRTTRVPAVHPCPWTISIPSSPASPTSEADNVHPRMSTVRAHAPPSFTLCEQAYRAYQKQLQLILIPAMTNIVRRFVIECTSGIAGDPAVRVARMNLEEVLAELRTPGVWFDGVDWASGGLGGNRGREQEREREEDSASSASSRSDGSHTTSPVLSTTTLQTTPSPPPAHAEDKGKEKHSEGTSVTRQLPSAVIPIPVSPVLQSPKLLHPIPYIPVTVAHMARYSLEAFKMAWREACAPLFHCRCSICERAMVNANAAAGHPIPTQAHPHNPPPTVPQQPQQKPQRPTEIALEEEVRARSRENVLAEEEEEEEEEEELYEEEEEEEESDDELFDNGGGTLHPPVNTHAVTPRKRSSGDLEADNLSSAGEVGVPRVGTPPKRARTGALVVPSQATAVDPPRSKRGDSFTSGGLNTSTAPRQRKRSSEELETSGSNSPSSNDLDKQVGSLQKRLRVEPSPSSNNTATPRSLSASPPSSVTITSSSEEEDKSRGYVDVGLGEGNLSVLKAGLVNGGELDGLYVFEET